MALLALVFVSIVVLAFTVITVLTRETQDEKSVGRRIAMIHASKGDGASISPGSAGPFLKAERTSNFRRLDAIVLRYRLARGLQLQIAQANSSATVSILILSSLGLAVLGYTVTWFFVPIIPVDIVAGVVVCFLPFWVLSFRRSRRINAFNAVLADTIDMLARSLRAGYSMSGAIEMISENAQEPAASEFQEIFKQLSLGLPLRDALMQLLDRFPSLDLRVLVTAILVQKDTGGNLAEILDRTVFVIRDRLRIQGEIRVQTAQGRLTGWILSALPVVMVVLINLVNPGYSSILISDPTGRMIVYIGLGMLAIGTWMIHYIVRGIEV